MDAVGQKQYRSSLGWVLRRRMDAMMGILLISICTYAFPFKSIGCMGDEGGGFGDFTIRYTIPPQYGYYDRVKIVDEIEAYVEDHKEEWGVEVYTSRLNGSSSSGRTTLYLETDEPPMTPEEVIEAAKEDLPQIVGSKVYIGWDGGRDNLQITLTLRGESTDTLERLGKQVSKVLGQVPGILSIDQALEDESMPEIHWSSIEMLPLSTAYPPRRSATRLPPHFEPTIYPNNKSTTMTST